MSTRQLVKNQKRFQYLCYMRRRYYPRKKPNYSKLFDNDEDKAKMLYNKDMNFRIFVQEWNGDDAELIGWPLVDFYKAYTKGGYQLEFNF